MKACNKQKKRNKLNHPSAMSVSDGAGPPPDMEWWVQDNLKRVSLIGAFVFIKEGYVKEMKQLGTIWTKTIWEIAPKCDSVDEQIHFPHNRFILCKPTASVYTVTFNKTAHYKERVSSSWKNVEGGVRKIGRWCTDLLIELWGILGNSGKGEPMQILPFLKTPIRELSGRLQKQWVAHQYESV